MNQFLTSLFNAVAIDSKHLKSNFLKDSELDYLNQKLKSEQDLCSNFYTSEYGENLECLLFFLTQHKELIIEIMAGIAPREALIELYTSASISGNYNCFRFDLSMFPQSYLPINQEISVYRIGRETENTENLGCSWSTSIEGLNAYCDASSLTKDTLESRPIFIATIDDNQVLFKGKSSESELVLKKDFSYKAVRLADDVLRRKIGR